MRLCLVFFLLSLACSVAGDSGLNASQIAAKMTSAVEDGESIARVRMKQGSGEALQVQIKSHRSDGRAEVAYEILWPPARKGEKVVLRQGNGNWPEGVAFSADGKRTVLDRAHLEQGIFGTELAFIDTVENFFLWPDQEVVGQEKIGRVDCIILESRPSSGSPHSKVRSWIDPQKFTVLRTEKYKASGQLVRIIVSTQFAKDDMGRTIPAALSVRGEDGSTTEIDGSNIRHDVKLTAADFAF